MDTTWDQLFEVAELGDADRQLFTPWFEASGLKAKNLRFFDQAMIAQWVSAWIPQEQPQREQLIVTFSMLVAVAKDRHAAATAHSTLQEFRLEVERHQVATQEALRMVQETLDRLTAPKPTAFGPRWREFWPDWVAKNAVALIVGIVSIILGLIGTIHAFKS